MIKITKKGSVKYITPERKEYYEKQGWSVVGNEPVKATLKPAKNTVKTPAVESTDSEKVVNDEQKGE